MKNEKVLLIEDSAFTRRLLRGMLKDLGFQAVTEASDGLEAEKLLKLHRFDAMLIDWRMPRQDGAEFLARLRAHDNPVTAATPAIIISAHVDLALLQKAATLGAQSVVVKPFSLQVLKSHIDAALARPIDRAVPDARSGARPAAQPEPVAVPEPGPAPEDDAYEVVFL
ncbi:response regulator [Stappia indica]|uniref:Response regulator n=1 Tax=Stappia indica TaxID=538381 RepID=A0A857C7A3_9HYPH|nr:response regulator [Stappia indica]QGZ34906.1 response regulator [Stappia indica]